MTEECREQTASAVRSFRLPRYREIPEVGLYLEQTAKYLSEYLGGLMENGMTASMISNYVKKRLIESPRKKQYGREQIADLFFIAVMKSVLSLDDLKYFLGIQRETYPAERAYNYFCEELENILAFVFALKEKPEEIGKDSSDEKLLLRSAIIAVFSKIYLEKCFDAMRAGAEAEEKRRERKKDDDTTA